MSPCDNCFLFPVCVSKKGHIILEDCELTVEYIINKFKAKCQERLEGVEIKFPIKELQDKYLISVFEGKKSIVINCYNHERYLTTIERESSRKESHFMYINKITHRRR